MAQADISNAVLAPVEKEKAAITAGNPADYLVTLTDDAVFLPPHRLSKAGEELRAWLSSFVRDFQVE